MRNLALFGGEKNLNIKWPEWPYSDDKEVKSLERVLKSKRWFSGFLGGDTDSEVGLFEKEYAEYNNSKHAIAVANGEAALIIALRSAGIGAGDEVILPAWTFVATATAAMHIGAIPVFADITPENLCLDPEDVKAKLTDKTKAIITVHYGGKTGNIDELVDISDRKKIILIEDAAHAQGSIYNGKKAGNFGHLGCFSFQESKTITSGEGGLLTTNDDEIASLAKSYRSNGRSIGSPGYVHYRLGWNYRMTEFQGAILREQLKRLDNQVKKRTENAQILVNAIDEIQGFTPIQDSKKMEQNSYYLFPLRIDRKFFGITKENSLNYAKRKNIKRNNSLVPESLVIEDILKAEGLPCNTVYIPLYKSPLFDSKTWGKSGMQIFSKFLKNNINLNPLKNSDEAFDEVLDISHFVLLGDSNEIKTVINILKKVSRNASEIKKELNS